MNEKWLRELLQLVDWGHWQVAAFLPVKKNIEMSNLLQLNII